MTNLEFLVLHHSCPLSEDFNLKLIQRCLSSVVMLWGCYGTVVMWCYVEGGYNLRPQRELADGFDAQNESERNVSTLLRCEYKTGTTSSAFVVSVQVCSKTKICVWVKIWQSLNKSHGLVIETPWRYLIWMYCFQITTSKVVWYGSVLWTPLNNCMSVGSQQTPDVATFTSQHEPNVVPQYNLYPIQECQAWLPIIIPMTHWHDTFSGDIP